MEKVKFKEIFTFEKKSKIKAGDGFKLGEGKFPFYTSSDTLSKTLNEFLFENESLIFGTGGLASIHHCNEKFAVSTDCFVSQVKNDKVTFAKFIYYYLSGNMYLLENGFKGAGLKHISKGYIEDLEIPLPSLQTQQKIAAILDKADEFRQYNKQLIAKYDALTQSLFLDMFGDPVKNEKGWDMSKLEDFCKFENGDRSSNYPSGNDIKKSGKLFLSSGDIKKGKFIVNDSRFISNDKYNSLKRGKCYRNDVLMTLRGNGTGKSAIFDCEYKEGFINAQMVIIRPNEKCEQNYLVLQLNNPLVFKRLISFNSGSAQPQLSAQTVKEFKVFLPPIVLQNQFAERVKLIETQKQQAQEALAKSELLFQGLLQQAFKGELNYKVKN